MQDLHLISLEQYILNIAMGNSLVNVVIPSTVLLFLFGSYMTYHRKLSLTMTPMTKKRN